MKGIFKFNMLISLLLICGGCFQDIEFDESVTTVTSGAMPTKVVDYNTDTVHLAFDFFASFENGLADTSAFSTEMLAINSVLFKIDSITKVDNFVSNDAYSILLLYDLSAIPANESDIGSYEREVFCRSLFQAISRSSRNNALLCGFGNAENVFLGEPVRFFAHDFLQDPSYFDQTLAALHENYAGFYKTGNPYIAIDSCLNFIQRSTSAKPLRHILLASNSEMQTPSDTAIAGKLKRAGIKLSFLDLDRNFANQDLYRIAALTDGINIFPMDFSCEQEAEKFTDFFEGRGSYYRLHITGRRISPLQFVTGRVISTYCRVKGMQNNGDQFVIDLPVIWRFN
jgi:hypothetical protein